MCFLKKNSEGSASFLQFKNHVFDTKLGIIYPRGAALIALYVCGPQKVKGCNKTQGRGSGSEAGAAKPLLLPGKRVKKRKKNKMQCSAVQRHVCNVYPKLFLRLNTFLFFFLVWNPTRHLRQRVESFQHFSRSRFALPFRTWDVSKVFAQNGSVGE